MSKSTRLKDKVLNLNKDRSSQKNINFLREKLIADPRISARKNGLDIGKSTFNQITKRDLKWHPYKMHVEKY